MKKLLVTLLLVSATCCTKENLNRSSASSLHNAVATGPFYIGQSYGGGIIYYIDSTGQHGLIAAPNDIDTAAKWWNGTYMETGASENRIGSGARNTKKIIKSQGKPGKYAALLCARYSGGGYTDWYLPSKDELYELHQQQDLVGGFSRRTYWSSTEEDSFSARNQYFSHVSKTNYYIDKSNKFYVRPIRSF